MKKNVALVMLLVWGVVVGAGIAIATSSMGGGYTICLLYTSPSPRD